MLSQFPCEIICSICIRNSFFFVRTCANLSLGYDRLACLSILLFCTILAFFVLVLCGVALKLPIQNIKGTAYAI